MPSFIRCGFKWFGAALLLSGSVAAGAGSWGYHGQAGPEHWSGLSADYRLCSQGRNQSPVDLVGLVAAELPPLRFDYGAAPAQVRHNGHTVQVDYAAGHSLLVGERVYELKQFHFHAPAENLIDGRRYPMEVHLVHADAAGQLAVVGVMFEAGAASPLLSRLWAQVPAAGQPAVPLSEPVDAQALVPSERAYFRYSGSLTTPPCSEGVLWVVMKYALSASPAQIEGFSRLMGHPNSRPVQPPFARPLLGPR